MAVTEQIELLGKGLYTNIPDVLTLTSIPTAAELEYVSSEDFDSTMLESILPKAVKEEGINFKELLEIDYQWILRCLRLLNYGPYHTTNAIYCSDCGEISYGEHRVNLETIQCKPLPEGFANNIVIKADEFIEFDKDIRIQLPTIQDILNAEKDKAFQTTDGRPNRELARICYMVKAVGDNDTVTPLEVKMIIQNSFSPADYVILKSTVAELSDYGLRAGGEATCPKCHSKNAAFLALVNDKFFRPTVGDLRKWRDDKRARRRKNSSSNAPAAV